MKPAPSLIRLLALTAFLLPLSAFADSQLSLSDSAQSGDCDSAIVDCHSYPYNNNQTSMAGSSLSDGASTSDAGWGVASFSADVFYGSFHADGSTSALESVEGNTLGGASVSSSGSWTNAITVNSPGLDGQAATVRITLHTSGGAGGSSSSYYAGSNASYNCSVGDGFGGTGVSGQWDTTNGWDSNGPPNHTLIFDATCTFGQPCEITHAASFTVGSSTGEPDFGDPQNASTSGSGSFSFHSGSVQVLDPANDNSSVSFTTQSNAGWGRGDVVAPGASFAGLSLTNGAPGHFGSTVSLRDGVATAIRNVLENWVAPPHDVVVASDVVDVSGTDTDPVTIQLSYDPNTAVALFGTEGAMRLVWMNPATQELVNAVAGNTGGVAKLIKGAYNAATDFHLGNYGLDTIAHVVWAVVNHNSEFMVAHVEPVPLYLTGISKGTSGHKLVNGFGIPLKTYMVQATSDLSQPFVDLAPVSVAANGALQFEDQNPGTKRFYRVVSSSAPEAPFETKGKQSRSATIKKPALRG